MRNSGERYFITYKPYGMVSQFTPEGERATLAALGAFPRDVYPVGRLDADSEGLLLLTNDKSMNHRLLDPAYGHARAYLVQVEGAPDKPALQRLEAGLDISVGGKPYRTRRCQAVAVDPPSDLPPRTPPVRFRKTVPDSWIELTLREGKNRQVRKMCAAAGFPVLRLIRLRIGALSLPRLEPGAVTEVSRETAYTALGLPGGGQM
jgi:23S rRNA pseudouridine2457 synthase